MENAVTSSDGIRKIAISLVTAALALGFVVPGRGQSDLNASQNGGKMTQTTAAQKGVTDESIRPFKVNIPKEALDDLHRRIISAKWPEQELVSDGSQGVQLATMKKLA